MSATQPTMPDLRDLLAFYAEAGADEPLMDEPVDRFAESARAASLAAKPRAAAVEHAPVAAVSALPISTGEGRMVGSTYGQVPDARRQQATVPDGTQAAQARALAQSATTLDALRAAMTAFEGCNLKATAKSTVFADGNPQAAVMLVGDAPGSDEDVEGLPFVGRYGQMLDRMLASIGLDRTSVYIANVIPWRPPGNRKPTPHETEICRPFIERHIELANPRVLVALGGPATALLTGQSENMLRLRGVWRVHTTMSGVAIPIMPTLHPDYLLRTPLHKKFAWRDLLEVKAKLKTLA